MVTELESLRVREAWRIESIVGSLYWKSIPSGDTFT